MKKVRTVYILSPAHVDWLSFLKYREVETGREVALVNRKWTERGGQKRLEQRR